MKKKILLSIASAVLMLGVFAGTALAEDLNGTLNPVGGYNSDLKSKLVTNESDDNGVLNANNTGENVSGQDNKVNDVIKSDGMLNNKGEGGLTTTNQRTHGEYQNNTNSCASCHQTHTAAGKTLLFKDGVYTTCTACHDGTLGFYNVFASGAAASTAGTFGGNTNGNPSMHLANGTLQMKAAPGGNQSYTAKGDADTRWVGEFNCASCHSAHGSYSDRLLNYNPNDMGAVKPEEGGIKADDVKVIDFSDGTWNATDKVLKVKNDKATTKYIAVRGTKDDHVLSGTAYTMIDATNDSVIMIYELTGADKVDATINLYKKTTNPWLYGYPVRGSSGNNHWYYSRLFTDDPTNIVNNTGDVTTDGTYPSTKADKVIDHYDNDAIGSDAHFEYGKGLVYGPKTGQLKDAKFVEIARAYVVKFDLVQTTNYGGVPIYTVNEPAFFSGNKVDGSKASGLGIAMSQYCAACHTDYMAKAGSKTGIFGAQSYRHTTTSDSYTCVRCHFAHGTERDIMKDAEGRTVADLAKLTGWTQTKAEDYMIDKNPSSALKRFTNMAVCWGCHTSSHAEQLKNNDFFMNTNSADVPHGLTDTNVPNVKVDDTNNTILGLDTTMEYSVGTPNATGTTYTYVAYVKYDGSTAPTLTGEKKVKVRYAVVSGINSNPAVTIDFTYRPNVTVDDVNNTIVGLDNTMEYRISTDGGTNYGSWTNGDTIPVLTGGLKVQVRYLTPESGVYKGAVTLTFTA